MHREFPRYASEWEDGDSRRNFIKLMGASLALAGLTACTRQPTRTHHALRAAARRTGARPSAVFRHGHAAGLQFHRLAGGKPRRAAHQGGRQSGPSQPGRVRRLFAGIRAGALRSGSLAGADARRRDPVVGRVPGRHSASHHAAEGQARRGTAHSDRDGHFAHAGRSDQGNADGISRREVASMGTGRRAFGQRPERGWHSDSRSIRSTICATRT